MRARCPIYLLVALTLVAGVLSSFGRAPLATTDTYSVSKSATLSESAPGVLTNDTADNTGQSLTIAALASQTFTFDGITFDQALTPNLIYLLPPDTYDGAIVTIAPEGTATAQAGFPEVTTGFLPSMSVGHLYSDSVHATQTKSVNLPQGGNGRGGIELRWGAGVTLNNLAGDDFVVFEAGDTSSGAEAFMVQVHNADTDSWSAWVYLKAQSFKLLSHATAGLWSTKFNLDTFGVSANGRVDRIRIVNVIPKDRVVNASGEGVVIPEDNGVTSANKPLTPAGADFLATTYDADITYVGVLHPLQSTIPSYASTSELGATVTLNTDGSFTYDPSTSSTLQNLSSGQSAVDTFYYLVTDSVQGYARGTVSITVSGPTAPALTIVKSGNNVIVKWPATPGFVLQATDSLTDLGWSEVEIEPTVDGGDLSVTLDATEGNMFFRLSTPPDA